MFASGSRIEGGTFSKCGSRLSGAHTSLKNDKSVSASRGQRARNGLGRTQDCEGATVTLIRGVGFKGIMFWHDPGSSRRNNHVHSWRWGLKN
eukprot:5583041-Pyramimonas_sp.AAC.1